MPTATQRGTASATLIIVESMANDGAGDFAELFDDIAWILGAAAVASALPPRRSRSPAIRALFNRPLRRYSGPTLLSARLGRAGRRSRVLYVSYASPVEIVVEVAGAITASTAALTALIIGFRQLRLLPMELEADDAEVEARFLEATRRAREAQLAIKALDLADEPNTPEIDAVTTAGFSIELHKRRRQKGKRIPLSGTVTLRLKD
jgi:hypothetical protein